MHGLKELRVIDHSSQIAGPYCSKLFADAGADVVKLEASQGDRLRTWSATGADLGGRDGALFRYLNASKRSVVGVLDEAGGGESEALIAGADALLENFSPRVMEDFGVSWEKVQALNPRCHYVRMPAFGLDGPWREYVGFAAPLEKGAGNRAQHTSRWPKTTRYGTVPDNIPSPDGPIVPRTPAPHRSRAMAFGNLAHALDIVAEIRADEDSLIQGSRHLSWRQIERRARNLSAWMLERGTNHQGKVAVYTYNHPAYRESIYAAFKASLVPVNVNYRYRAEELRYLLDNSDAEIVVVHEDFAPLLEEVLPDLPQILGVLVVEETGAYDIASIAVGKATAKVKAAPYEATAETDRPAIAARLSPDDLTFLYTGGTTGMPKGVMWRQGDIFTRFGGGGIGATPETEEAYREFVKNPPMRYRSLIGPPLMHGTGWFQAMIAWLVGGVVVVLESAKKFNAAELWRTVDAEKITSITIVGDPFAKPMAVELEENGDAYDISSVVMIASSGVMWSEETKQRLLAHHSGVVLADAFGSAEAIGLGMSFTTAAGSVQTGKFQLSDSTKLFNADLELIESKPGARGLVGVGGLQPLGYYKDPEKTAKTFVECEAGRFSVPGDWAEVNEDGLTLSLLGRGSVCINTGGEKVFPEEVEEVVKRFEGVKDVVVVGVPDDRWGEAITAVVSSHQGALDGAAIIEHVKGSLAGYKAPKHVVQVSEVYRSPAGKADFKRTRQTAMARLGIAD